MRRLLRWLLRAVALVVALVVLLFGALYFALRRPAVPVLPGEEAEALGREVEQAVCKACWERTRALRWTARGGRDYLWDRDRSYVRYRHGDVEVLFAAMQQKGRAYRAGVEVTDAKARQAMVDRAYQWWLNDSFWLNPLVKLFDDGTSRAAGRADGQRVLEIRYASGGVTPGDRYQWFIGDDGRPTRWHLFVQILPVPGAEFTWEGWQKLSTGAWVATVHRALGRELVTVSDLAGGATLGEVAPGADPFARLTAP